MLSSLRKIGQAATRRWPFPVRATTKTGASLYVDLRFQVGRSIYARGEFDPPVLNAVLQALTPSSVFLDLGANVGFYSVEAARVVTEGQIHAFEMDDRSLHCLEKTVRAFGLDQLKIHKAAVSDRSAQTFFKADETEAGHSHLDPAAASGRAVQTVSIDDWVSDNSISRIDVVKIDVEGAELLVLKGACKTLQTFRPVVVIEAVGRTCARFGHTPEDVLNFLRELGYTVEPLKGAWTPAFVAR